MSVPLSPCTQPSLHLSGNHGAARSAHRWKVLAVGVAANVGFSAAVSGLPTTAVLMRTGYQLSDAHLGLVLGLMGLGIALCELPWGLLTDRWGDRPVLLTGLAATSFTLMMMALLAVPTPGHPHQLMLATGLIMAGLLGASVNGASGRAVMAWFREGERGLAMSIRQTAVPLGGGVGALLLPWLASSFGFAAVYGALAAMCAAPALLAWLWLHEPPPRAASTNAAPERAATAPGMHGAPLKDARIWRMVLAIGLLCCPQFAVLTFATVFLHDYGHAGAATITVTMVIVQLGAMVMRVWSGHRTDRRGAGARGAYLRTCTMSSAAAFAVLSLVTALAGASGTVTAIMLAATLVIAGICVSAWHGVAYAELATLSGAGRAGTALGLANTCVYAGYFFTPLAIPHILASWSWTAVWLAASGCALLALPIFPASIRNKAAGTNPVGPCHSS